MRCLNGIILAPKPSKDTHYSIRDLHTLANAACLKAGAPIPHPNCPTDSSLVSLPPENLKDT